MKTDYTMFSPATQVEIARWREKVQDDSITVEELKAAITMMRADRTGAVNAAAASARSGGPPIPRAARARASAKASAVASIDTAKLMEGF
jgi:hypothetical protein